MAAARDRAGGPATTAGDLISGQLARFYERGLVRSGLVGDARRERSAFGEPAELEILRRLLMLLMKPGRLDVRTADRRFRLLYTGAVDIALALEAHKSPDDEEVDLWLKRIEQIYRQEVR